MSNIFGKFCNCLLAFISQVTVRLVIYFDQQIMKEITTETASITTSTLELSSSLVCLTDVPSNLSTQSTTQGDNRAMESTESEDDEYKGIGNIVGGISEKKINFLFLFQFAICQLAWMLLEYTRTAMFHWMFLEVKQDKRGGVPLGFWAER